MKIDAKKGSPINVKDFVFQRPGNNGLNEYEIFEMVAKKYTYRKNFKIGEKFKNEV